MACKTKELLTIQYTWGPKDLLSLSFVCLCLFIFFLSVWILPNTESVTFGSHAVSGGGLVVAKGASCITVIGHKYFHLQVRTNSRIPEKQGNPVKSNPTHPSTSFQTSSSDIRLCAGLCRIRSAILHSEGAGAKMR